MPTSVQLTRTLKRKPKVYKDFRIALGGSPQRIAKLCANVREMTPRKPNSAKRKIARVSVRLKHGVYKRVFAYLAGEHWKINDGLGGIGQGLKIHDLIWIRGGKTNDVPGLKYKIMHGILGWRDNKEKKNQRSVPAPLIYLKKKRSKYSIPRPKVDIRKAKHKFEFQCPTWFRRRFKYH